MFKKIINICTWILIAVLGIFSLWTTIDKSTGYGFSKFGYRSSVIVSNSMSFVQKGNDYITDEMLQYQKFDIVVTKNYSSFDEIQMYDVATYFSPNGLICHRVVDKYIDEEGNPFVVFRGDANNINDAPVSYSMIRGKVVNCVPKVGEFLLFFQSPYLLLALCGIGFFVTLGIYLYSKDDVDYTFGIKRR